MNILIVEDEQSIREMMRVYLEKAGYTVFEAGDGQAAWSIFTAQPLDLVLLDLNLPKQDGVSLCLQIRTVSQVPIIMVTARVEELDELVGLDVGADDYIKKPFSPRVLIARIQARLRQRAKKSLVRDGLELYPERMEVINHGEKVYLTVTQFNILYTLAHDPGRVFTRDEILEYAYDQALPPDVMDRTVDAHIKSIRKVIETDAKHPQRILTVIGKGYKFNDEA